MLAKDGISECELEFIPCIQFNNLEKKYQRAFLYCYHNVHKLKYYPKKSNLKCGVAAHMIKQFANSLNAKLILYKGGTIEKKLCEKLRIDSINIEDVGAEKINSHSPRIEINAHYNYLLNMGCLC